MLVQHLEQIKPYDQIMVMGRHYHVIRTEYIHNTLRWTRAHNPYRTDVFAMHLVAHRYWPRYEKHHRIAESHSGEANGTPMHFITIAEKEHLNMPRFKHVEFELPKYLNHPTVEMLEAA